MRIALPIVAANVTVPLLGLVDTAVVGQMGLAAPIGAVGMGAVILSSVIGSSGSCAWARWVLCPKRWASGTETKWTRCYLVS